MIGVVIATRDRPQYLSLALQSVLAQTLKAERIVVVDGGAGDDTKRFVESLGVVYERIESAKRLCWPAKRRGVELVSDLRYSCQIDDDDYVPPDYLAKMAQAIESGDYGWAYPRIQMFGDDTRLVDRDAGSLGVRNWFPSTCLVRNDALAQIGGWPVVRDTTNCDWAAWSRLASVGWRAVKADTTYFCRRHSASMSHTVRVGNQWCDAIDIGLPAVTIAVPFCGRNPERVLQAIEAQEFPRSGVELLFLDNSLDESVGRMLRGWLALCSYRNTRYVVDDVPAVPGKKNAVVAGVERDDCAISHRVAGVWNRIARLATTELIWCLEDDVVPPENALEHLLRSMNENVDAVSGVYHSRSDGHVVAWRYASLDPLQVEYFTPSEGVGIIDGCGFGCVLLRRSVFANAIRSDGPGHHWPDWNLWLDHVRGQDNRAVLLDWSVQAEHLV